MFIDRLIVRGYRSLYYTDLPLKPGKNILVGKNNAGKSNIVDALNIVLGERYPTYVDIEPDDFYTDSRGERESEFWVLCSIKGNDWDRRAIHSLSRLYRTTARFTGNPLQFDSDGILTIEENRVFFDPGDLRSGTEKETLWASQIPVLVNELEKADFMAFIFRVTKDLSSDEGYSKDFRFIYHYNADGKGAWHVVWGITNEFRQAFLTSAVLRAFRDPGSELRITNWSWYGKLITKTWEKARSNNPKLEERLSSAFLEAEAIGNEVYSGFSNHLEQTIRIGFRDTQVTFKFADTSPSDFHKRVQVYINDGLDAPIIRKGAGIQSAVIIGLFSYYCQTHHSNTSVLVVEEPEIFLHPHARRAISRRLDRFVTPEVLGKENQVIITTHSAEYIQAGDASSITVVRKIDGQTQIKSLDLAGLGSSIKQRMLRAASGDMFFADRVILCEGAEAYLIPRVAEKLAGSNGVLDEHNISVIRVDGKGSFKSYTDALEALGIPWLILADFDFFLKGLGDFLPNKDPLRDIYSRLAQKIRAIQSEISAKLKGVEKTLKDKTSNQRKAFIQAMQLFRENPSESNREMVFNLWDEIITNSTGKIDMEVLNGQPDLKNRLLSFLEELFNKKNIWILRRGELEDYATGSRGIELFAGEKIRDSSLLEVCLDPNKDLSEFLDLDEFERFLGTIVPLDTSIEPSRDTLPLDEDLPF